ncbi:hypothetical protein Zmor_021079 [Zophobas morio]|uniref:Tetraspanin n=1 Tax=Zophobas morio TaxID=2755281 RepID=A0AA38MAR5_9CUCU|nr:hypothetical protein Zmor_021079 [Zophobas morio]
MSCISEFAKYLLLVFNFIISVCAITLIVFGIIYYMQENHGVNVFSDIGSVFSLGILAMCVGVIILFIAAFGCCGALHQNTCLLTIYASILIILFALQLAVGVLALVKIIDENDFFVFVRDILRELFDSEDTEDIKSFRSIQSQFECCGVNNYTDYDTPPYPSSCCGRTNCYLPYKIGCAEAFTNALSTYIQVIAYVAIGFAVIELIGAILSFLIRKENIRNKLRVSKRNISEDTLKIEETSI